MLYSGKGDGGYTTVFNNAKKFSKDSTRIEVLGTLDELNSLLGICKVKAKKDISEIIESVQDDLFIIQAEVANVNKKLKNRRTKEIEKIIDSIEKKLPKIKSFTISGGTELSALLDYSRAVARRTERRVVALKGRDKLSAESIKYLNRLSSLLFALARLSNKNRGIKEKKPKY